MAETPAPNLRFDGGCPDCGTREITLPGKLPDVGDDFDWRVRDFDGFRRFMLEELAARFPERRRWTSADMEVVLVEQLAAVLDQLSDMLDRASAEAFLETARRPSSVRRLLKMIGFDAANEAGLADEKLEALWSREPHQMEVARLAGPRSIHRQRRLVTLGDYTQQLEDHPLVLRAHAWSAWSGSWTTHHVAVILSGNLNLDDLNPAIATRAPALRLEIDAFLRARGLTATAWAHDPSARALLRAFLDATRMAAQEVRLVDAERIPVTMALSIRVDADYFQSEIRGAIAQTLGHDPGGLFAPGALRFGEDLHASDLFERLLALDGVETVCLNRFKRMGHRHPDRADSGRIALTGIEVAICDNDPNQPRRGNYTLKLHGGIRG